MIVGINDFLDLLFVGLSLYSRRPRQVHIDKRNFLFSDSFLFVEDNFGRLLIFEGQSTFGVHVINGYLVRVNISVNVHQFPAYIIIVIPFHHRMLIHLQHLLVDNFDFILLLLVLGLVGLLDYGGIIAIDLIMSIRLRGIVIECLFLLLNIKVIIGFGRQLLLGGPLLSPSISRKIVGLLHPILRDNKNVILSLLVAFSKKSFLRVLRALNLITLFQKRSRTRIMRHRK